MVAEDRHYQEFESVPVISTVANYTSCEHYNDDNNIENRHMRGITLKICNRPFLTKTKFSFPFTNVHQHVYNLIFVMEFSFYLFVASLLWGRCDVTFIDVLGIVHFRVRYDRCIKEVKTHFLQP